MAEGASDFFGQFLQGFGGSVVEQYKARQQRDLERSAQAANLWLKGVFEGIVDPDAGYEGFFNEIMPMLQVGERGRRGKGPQSPIASLAEPANAAAFVAGMHPYLTGAAAQTPATTSAAAPTTPTAPPEAPAGPQTLGPELPARTPWLFPSPLQPKPRELGRTVAEPTQAGDVGSEADFQRWYAQHAGQWGLNPDPDAPEQSYDYRAAYRAGAGPNATGHWPSEFKREGHRNLVVGGFHTQTGERVPGTPRAKNAAELVALGWAPEDAARLAASPEPPAGAAPETAPPPPAARTGLSRYIVPLEEREARAGRLEGLKEAAKLDVLTKRAYEAFRSGQFSTFEQALDAWVPAFSQRGAGAQAGELRARDLYDLAVKDFQARMGRPPTAVEASGLMQTAIRQEATATHIPTKDQADAVSYQDVEMLLDGEPTRVGYNPKTNTFHYQGQDVTARVKPVPPRVDPTVAALRDIQLEQMKAGHSPQQVAIFNQIAGQYQRSPLINAADRSIVLQDAIKTIRADPKNAAAQLQLAYAWIQAVDTYQSAVREGELLNIGAIATQWQNLLVQASRVYTTGAFMPPEVAQQIADTSEQLIRTITVGAQRKLQEFSARAKASGVETMWEQFVSGMPPPPGTDPKKTQTTTTTQKTPAGLTQPWEGVTFDAKGNMYQNGQIVAGPDKPKP